MRDFAGRYARLLVRYKVFVLGFTVLATVFFAWNATKVITLNALENMLPENDPELQNYHQLNRHYGGDFILMIALEADEIFKPIVLAHLAALTKDLESQPEVDRVLSLTNVPQIVGKDGQVAIGPLVNTIPDNDEDMTIFKKMVQSDPLYTNSLVHASLPVTALYVRLKHQEDLILKQSMRDAFVPKVKALLKKYESKISFQSYLAGNVTLEYQLDKSARENQLVTTILMLGMISAVLFYLFRRLSAVLACLLAVGLSSVWTTGLVGLIGLPLNFVTSLLPPLILVVAVLDCIHIYATFRILEPGLSPEEKIKRTMDHLLIPCLVTGFTTFIGFGSMITSDMSVLRHFGFLSAFGIASALFIAIGPLPLLLIYLPDLKNQKTNKDVSPFLQKAVNFFIGLSLRHWKANLFVSIAILLIALAGYPRLFIETRPVDFYPKNSQIPRDFYFVDQNFNGSTTSDTVIFGPPGSFTIPKYLNMADEFSQAAKVLKELSEPLSVVNLLKKTNQAIHDGDADFAVIPQTQAEVEQLYLFLQGDPYFQDLITSDYSSIRIHQQVKAIGSRNGLILIKQAQEIAQKYIKQPLKFFITGSNIVWMNMESYIVQSQITGFACDLLITLLLIFMLRSIKWGLLSMAPNLFPVLCTFGVMAWIGIPLNMVTTMVASIAIGLAVDDTVHLMLHIRNATQSGRLAMEDAITEAFQDTGPAVVSTSLVLAMGFWMLCLTDFLPSRQFGFLGGLTFIFGMISELMLLPALLKILAPFLMEKSLQKNTISEITPAEA